VVKGERSRRERARARRFKISVGSNATRRVRLEKTKTPVRGVAVYARVGTASTYLVPRQGVRRTSGPPPETGWGLQRLCGSVDRE
jgi:hypothetical protein